MKKLETTTSQTNTYNKMRKIDVFANWVYKNVGQDGLMHIICTALLLKVLWVLFGLVPSLILITGIGFAKEIFYDTKYSGKDVICNLIGIAICLLIRLL